MAAEEEEKPVPDSGAIFTFGKSKFADNCPSKFWLKNDKPAYIACGDEHTALVTGNGKLYVFGSNINGQLGIGSGNVITKPTCVKALKSEKIKLAACGRNHTLVCTAQGKVYSSGWNSEGQLGLGDTTERSSFQEIAFFNGQCKIKQLSAGSNTSAALTADGKLYIWGENSEGQLGLGSEKNICTPHRIDIGKPISWISCGYYHSAFVTQDGELYSFGEPENGKLGLPADKLDKHKKPQRVPGISGKVKMASCGGGHTVAVTDKEVYTFGLGQFGQLGHGTFIFDTNTPKVVDALKLHRIRYVACGENHTAVITDKGLLYSFGDGRYGKLGLGEENFTNQFSPTLCMNFVKFAVQSVACGGCHMLVFAIPRPKESELIIIEELKENYLTVNGDGEGSTSLQRSPSARVRRREKKHSPEQIRDLTRTLPPLNNNLLESSLPVPSRTVPPNLLKVRQVSSEPSAHDSAAASKSDEKQRHDLVKSFSADVNSDNVSQQSFGGTTDILNMTHAVSMNQGNSTFSPLHKRKKNIKNVELKGDGKVEMKERSRSRLSLLSLKNNSYSSNSDESGITSVDAQAEAVKKYMQAKFRKASEAGRSKFVASQEQLNIAKDAQKDKVISKANSRKQEKQILKDSHADLTQIKSSVTSLEASKSERKTTSQSNKQRSKHPQIIRVKSHEALKGLKMVGNRDGNYFTSKSDRNSFSSSSSDNSAGEKFREGNSLVTKLNSVLDGSLHIEKGSKCNEGNSIQCFKDEDTSVSVECSEELAKPKYFKKKKESKILVVKQKEVFALQENKTEEDDYEEEVHREEKKVGKKKDDVDKDNGVQKSEVEEDEETNDESEEEESENEETEQEKGDSEEQGEDESKEREMENEGNEEEEEEDCKDEDNTEVEGEEECEGEENENAESEDGEVEEGDGEVEEGDEGNEEEGEEDGEEDGGEEGKDDKEEEEGEKEGEEEGDEEEGQEEEDEEEGQEEDEEEGQEEDEEEGQEEDEEEGQEEEDNEEEGQEEEDNEEEGQEEEDEEEGQEEEDEEEGQEEEDEEEGQEEEDEEEGQEEEDEEEGQEEEDEEEGQEEEDEEEGQEEEDEEEGHEEEDEEEGQEEEDEEEGQEEEDEEEGQKEEDEEEGQEEEEDEEEEEEDEEEGQEEEDEEEGQEGEEDEEEGEEDEEEGEEDEEEGHEEEGEEEGQEEDEGEEEDEKEEKSGKNKKEETNKEESEEDRKDDEEEEDVEDEEEDGEVEEEEEEEDNEDNSATEKNESKVQASKSEEQMNTTEEATKLKQEENRAINKVENDLEKTKTVNGVNSSGNDSGKTTFLEKTRRLSLFKRRSTTSQRSLQGNGNVAAASQENGAEKSRSKENKDENQNSKPETPKVTEPPNEEAKDTGQNAQDRKSRSATCLLL